MQTELVIALLTAIGGAITTLIKMFKFIQEGELGIKLRCGRAIRDSNGKPKIIHPGFVLLIPYVDSLKRHHVRQQTIRMDDQSVMIHGGLSFLVSAIVIFRVNDIYKALFEIHELDYSINDISMGILRDILSQKRHNDLSDMDVISDELLKRLKAKADQWGVDFIQFKLINCAPTPETAAIVNAEVAVELKMEAINAAAKKLGLSFSEMPADLASALIGIPLVVAVSSDTKKQESITEKRETANRPLFRFNFGPREKERAGSEE